MELATDSTTVYRSQQPFYSIQIPNITVMVMEYRISGVYQKEIRRRKKSIHHHRSPPVLCPHVTLWSGVSLAMPLNLNGTVTTIICRSIVPRLYTFLRDIEVAVDYRADSDLVFY